jgi:hypothetical protein
MATTNTVTEASAGVTLYSFTALADADSFDFPGEYATAKRILFQVTGGTFNSSTVALVGSLNGTNYAPLYATSSNITTGVVVAAAASAIAANGNLWDVQPSRKLRLTVTGGTGTGITANVAIVTL